MIEGIARRRRVQVSPKRPRGGRLRDVAGLVGTVTSMAVCAVVVAPGALASPPVRVPAPIGNSNTFDAGTACPFTLQIELIGGNQAFTFFDDGRFHATGRHIDRFTNLDEGTSTTLEMQGSINAVPTADGGSILSANGITTFVFFPGDAGPGDTETGRVYTFTGGFVATSDPSGA